ncbi:MAG: hypothetical protein ACRDPR_01350 [Nocardioidaceae bacterium]
MTNTNTFRRSAAAAGLASTAALMAVSTVLAPEFPAGFADRLAAIADGGNRAWVSALAFTLAQLPFIAGMLGIGHLLRSTAPRLSAVGTSLAVLGGFGHSVFGGISLVQLEMAGDVAHRDLHAGLLERVESGPAAAFMAMGLIGTVLGLLLLSIGLFRAGVGPRWVGPALWAFLAVEFAGSAVSEWSSHLAVVLYVATFGVLAVTVHRSPQLAWQVVADEPAVAGLRHSVA